MYPKTHAAAVSRVARLGSGFMKTWSVSHSSTNSEVSCARISGLPSSWRIEFGRLSTPKWKCDSRTSLESSSVKMEGISPSRPSGLPPAVAQSRVKPTMSVHGPAIARCFFQWKYMMRDCHC